MKVDADGNQVWKKDYLAASLSGTCSAINTDDSYVFTDVMYPNDNTENRKCFLLSMDDSGNISN